MKRCGRRAFLCGDAKAQEGVELVYEEMKKCELGVWKLDNNLSPGGKSEVLVRNELGKAQRVIVLFSERKLAAPDELLETVLEETAGLSRRKAETYHFFVPVLLPTLDQLPDYIDKRLRGGLLFRFGKKAWLREWNRLFAKTMGVPPAFSTIRILTCISLSCIHEIRNNTSKNLYTGVEDLLSLSNTGPGPLRRLQKIAEQVKRVHQALESYYFTLPETIESCSVSREIDDAFSVPQDPVGRKKIADAIENLTEELGKEPGGNMVRLPEPGSTSIKDCCEGIGEALLDNANGAAEAISHYFAEINRVRDYLDEPDSLSSDVTRRDLLQAFSSALRNGDKAIIDLGVIISHLTTEFVEALRILHERARAGRS